MIYLLHICLAIAAFLMMLNGFFRGALKHQIHAGLGFILLSLLLTVFVTVGWEAGLLAVPLAFVYAKISRPVAARAAARLMSLGNGPSGSYIGLPPRRLERISRELGREVRPEDMMRELMATPSHREKAEEALFDYCLAQKTIQELLREFEVDGSILKELYSQLCWGGAGQWAGAHWAAASALAYPHTLRFLLTSRRDKANHLKVAMALIMHFERGRPLS